MPTLRDIVYENVREGELYERLDRSRVRCFACKEGVSEAVVPKFSQETLAEMVGTTPSRVSFFMNRFILGFIQYSGGVKGGLEVHSSLLNVVLHEGVKTRGSVRRTSGLVQTPLWEALNDIPKFCIKSRRFRRIIGL